jgi:hypothetical protein
VPVSAVDVISPAFEHMKRHLFKPFRFGQWLRLAIVGFLAGEMGSGGGGGVRALFDIPASLPSRTQQFQIPGMSGRGALFVLGVVLLALLAMILGIIFLYISSRMRFVLFDSIVSGECRIREFWNRHGTPAFRYFIFQLVFGLIGLVSLAIFIGVPVFVAYSGGLFRNPMDHIPALIFGGLIVLFIFVFWLVVFALGTVLTKDFVVPQMALENLTAVEGWRRLWAMMKSEKGAYAGYVGMKILLRLGTAIVLGLIGIIVFLILMVPIGGFGLVAILGGRTAGLTWNPVTIAIAVVVGGVLLLGLILVGSLISVPAVVLLPAYSVYFLADRYPPLRNLMYPPLIAGEG